jgi:CubicO group peptidase (beta-lactamase class C family)
MAAPLPRRSPESLGIPSGALQLLLSRWEKQEIHSFMILRHGAVAAEGSWAPYRMDQPHVLYSLSKSFASTAVGLCVEEGRFTLEDRVVELFAELAPAERSENLRQMRVRDLLTMSCGHATEAWPGRGWGEGDSLMKGFLAHEVPHKPGSTFFYNSLATYACSALVQKQTGQRARDYLMSRLFEPLGIPQPEWDQSPEGIDFGGWGLHLRVEDAARFGQLLLQDGVWAGKRLLPRTWVAQASARQVRNGDSGESDWSHGYGFQFWRCKAGCFRGDGAYGQLCVVVPEQDLIVAALASVDDIQEELNCIWELLPSLSESPLASAPQAEQALRSQIDALELPKPASDPGSASNLALAGRWRLPDGGPVLGIVLGPSGIHLELGDLDVAAGMGAWVSTVDEGRPIGASAAWKAGGALAVKIRWLDAPAGEDWALAPEGESQLRINRSRRGIIGAPPYPEVVAERVRS